jgi:hypothetical protein
VKVTSVTLIDGENLRRRLAIIPAEFHWSKEILEVEGNRNRMSSISSCTWT